MFAFVNMLLEPTSTK